MWRKRRRGMSQRRKYTVILALLIAFILWGYVVSYGPAWSIAVRIGDRRILNAYNILPERVKQKVFAAWIKLDDKVRAATINQLP